EASANFSLGWDPSILSLRQFVQGTFPTGSYIQDTSKPGHFWYENLGMSDMPPGSYTIVRITFDVVGLGITNLTLGPGDQDAGGFSTPTFYDSGYSVLTPANSVASGLFVNGLAP